MNTMLLAFQNWIFDIGNIDFIAYFEKDTFLPNLEIVLYDRKFLLYGVQRKTKIYMYAEVFNLILQRIENKIESQACITCQTFKE